MKPLLLGEAPSKNEATERPLEGRVGRRLAKLALLTYDEYLKRFDRVNLLHVRQDEKEKEKGFEFDLKAARVEAMRLREEVIKPEQTVILLGGRVSEAFGVHDHYFVKNTLLVGSGVVGTANAYILPHPSGVNRWWNEADNVKLAEEFMTLVARSS